VSTPPAATTTTTTAATAAAAAPAEPEEVPPAATAERPPAGEKGQVAGWLVKIGKHINMSHILIPLNHIANILFTKHS